MSDEPDTTEDEEFDEVDEIANNVKGTKLLTTGEKHLGERAVLLLETRVAGVEFERGKGDALVRRQRFAVLAAFELPLGEGADLLREARGRYRAADDALKGLAALPFDGTEVPEQYVDADGVLLLPAEVAAARGEKWTPERDLSVVFSDGTKAVWPDDWDEGQTLAPAGGRMAAPSGGVLSGKFAAGSTVQVVQLVDLESGDVLADWSDADEAERLAAVEASLAAVEEDLPPDETSDDGIRIRDVPVEDEAEYVDIEYPGTPWSGYGMLKVSAVKAELRRQTDPEVLRHALAFEERNGNRPTVLTTIRQCLAALLDEDPPVVEDEVELTVLDESSTTEERREALERFLAADSVTVDDETTGTDDPED